jgi:hypothetical protein
VVDLFAGSGTTGAAALQLGRRFILGDASPVAIATMRSRLLREGAPSLRLERCGIAPEKGDAKLQASPHGATEMEVVLKCPKDARPIAWALSTTGGAGSPFRTTWHAERGTGKSPSELPRKVVVPRASLVRARVYFIDGKVATPSTSLAPESGVIASDATAPSPGPTSWFEAPS